MLRFSNKNKLAMNFIALLFVGLLASSFVAYKHVEKGQKQAIENDLQLKASLVLVRLNHWVQQAVSQVEHFALFVATSNEPLRDHQLYQRYIEQHPDLGELEYLAYAQELDGYFGIFDWQAPDDYDPRQRPWYILGKQANRPMIGQPFISVEQKPRMLFPVTAPIVVNGDFVGLASAQISLEQFRASLAAVVLNAGGEVFLIDNQGKIIVDKDNRKTGSLWSEFTSLDQTMDKDSIQLIESADKLFFSLKQNTDLGWKLVLSMPKEEIDRELLNGTLSILGKFLLIFIVVMFGLYLTNRHLVSPLFDYMELDSVTLLPSKKPFKQRVINEFLLPNRAGYLLIINMDDFSRHTAAYPAAQIHLLQNEIKERIQAQLPDRAALGSFSESRYIVYCERDCEREELFCEDMLSKLSAMLATQYDIGGRDINCNFRIGASCYPAHSTDIEALIDYAFSALANVSKYQGCNYGLFSPETNQQFSDELLIDSAIKNALNNAEFTMVYQPQIDSRTGEMTSMEALIRWPSNELKRAVSPAEFIPIAERSAVIISLGDYVIESVLKQLNTWNQQGVEFGYVSINISPNQLLAEDFHLKLQQSILKHNVASEQVELEITETSVLENPLATIEVLHKLKSDGFAIAIDDFGTGYSSLQYLNMMPIDKLKIDRSLIIDLDKNEKTAILAKTIISMANNLKMNVLAEGVERREEASTLADLGCHLIQGYFYSKPLTPEAVTPFIENNKLLKCLSCC